MPPAVALRGEGARYRVAGFWRRTAGGLIDTLLLIPLVLLFGGAASALSGGSPPRLRELGFDYLLHLAIDGGTAGQVALIVGAVVVCLYLLVFSTTSGQTPGMRLVGVRVIDAYGDAPSLVRGIVRLIGLGLALGGFSLGWLWIGFSREKRGLHDLLAGTFVVLAAPLRSQVPGDPGAPMGVPLP